MAFRSERSVVRLISTFLPLISWHTLHTASLSCLPVFKAMWEGSGGLGVARAHVASEDRGARLSADRRDR